MNKESEGDDVVDVLGEDTVPETTGPPPTVSSTTNLAAVNNIFNATTMSALMSSAAAAAAAQPNLSSTLGNIRVTSTASLKSIASSVIASSPAVLPTELSSASILNSSANVLSTVSSTVMLGDNRSGSPNVEALNVGAAPQVTPASNIPPNIRALSSTQPSFVSPSVCRY